MSGECSKWSLCLEESVCAPIHSSFSEWLGQKCWFQGTGSIISKKDFIESFNPKIKTELKSN